MALLLELVEGFVVAPGCRIRHLAIAIPSILDRITKEGTDLGIRL